MPTDVDLFSILLVKSQTIPATDRRHIVMKELEYLHFWFVFGRIYHLQLDGCKCVSTHCKKKSIIFLLN